jgi:cytochrome c peroxidase
MRRLLLAVLLPCAAGALAAAGETAPSLASRDAVWRSIFARPPQVPPSANHADDAAKVALGALLFADKRLSGDGTRACVSCHDPARGFTDGRPKAQARDGSALQRNTPSLFNLAWSPHFFADGRAASLEDQARVPITASDEMAGDFASITKRLSADSQLVAKFAAAFPDTPDISETSVLAALAAFERTLVSPETRFDKWVSGDDTVLSPQERDGFSIFVGRGGCVGCHGGWRFTDDAFRDIGLPGDDPGRSAIVGGSPELKQFKTPGLRELTRTAPYMHDGSMPTLRQVIDHYAGGLVKRPSLDSNLERDLKLSETEKEALIAFLKTLSSQD